MRTNHFSHSNFTHAGCRRRSGKIREFDAGNYQYNDGHKAYADHVGDCSASGRLTVFEIVLRPDLAIRKKKWLGQTKGTIAL